MRFAVFITLVLSCFAARGEYPPDVLWDSPSAGPEGSMPLGNGDIGLNLWVEEGGDLLFYISKTDAWSENARLLKLGRVRVSFTPNPFMTEANFQQVLVTKEGRVRIAAGPADARLTVEVWVDANYPAVRLHAESNAPVEMRVAVESWRTEPRELRDEERHSAYGLVSSPAPIVVEADTFVKDGASGVLWYHRNERSIYDLVMRKQEVGAWLSQGNDPLLHRTFGALVRGPGLTRLDDTTLTAAPAKAHDMAVYAHTAQTGTAATWRRQIEALAETDTAGYAGRREAHTAWWRAFWDRSHIRLGGDAPDSVGRGYALQRYMSACAGRGAFPIKFNGSLFTVDAVVDGKPVDADYRRWGGPYWFQNTRLVYWPMLASGDHAMMRPLFNMYKDALPFARARTEIYFDHPGAFFPETMYFWGAYTVDNYGWDRTPELAKGVTENRYIRYHYDGMLELAMLLLEHHRYTGDDAYFLEQGLPLVDAFVTFYFEHYPRNDDGALRITPSQALETWWDATNPAPPIAGLMRVLDGLIALPAHLVDEEARKRYTQWRAALPPLPKETRDGETVLAPAEELPPKPTNSENPELYAIFPYRLFGVSREDLELARRTFKQRRVKGHTGWRQDETQAAILGLTDTAAGMLTERSRLKHEGSRFPAFWGPNFDWIPDQDHGGNLVMALQTMLMQTGGDTILLFPAWPPAWDVDFKLHAPGQTVVRGVYRDGALESLEVNPPEREKDV
ncbi:MAG: DUF5703 domain-containing protein [Candidatus Hydrogenedentota bacterium]